MIAATLLALGSAVTALPTSAPEQAAASPVTPTVEAMPPDGTVQAAIINADLQIPDSYTGATFHPESGGYTIYGDAATLDKVKAYFAENARDGLAADPVDFVGVQRSLDELHAIQQEIGDDVPWFEANGIKLAGAAVVQGLGIIEISLYNYSPDAAQLVVDHFGADRVRVAVGDSEHFTDGSRSNDSAPWTAGIKWKRPSDTTVQCSTGFAVRGERTYGPYILSAGHCVGAVGTTAEDMHGEDIGPITNRIWGGGSVDGLTIRAQSVRFAVWTGGPSTSDWRWVGGTYAATEGEQVAIDGGVSGLHRFQTVVAEDTCLMIDNHYVCELFVTRGSGGPAPAVTVADR